MIHSPKMFSIIVSSGSMLFTKHFIFYSHKKKQERRKSKVLLSLFNNFFELKLYSINIFMDLIYMPRHQQHDCLHA